MPMICCTSKLLAEIDDPPVETAAESATGDWYGHLFTVEHRKCILFIHERTLFVCLALGVTKADYRRIVPFFLDLLMRTLGQEGFNEEETDWLLSLHKDIVVGRTHNRSTLGSLNNRIGDAKYLIEYDGGLAHCDMPALVHRLNETPMGPIKYSNGLAQMKRMVGGGMCTED